MNSDQFRLDDTRIAVIVSDGFEQTELDYPSIELQNAGATIHVLAAHKKQLLNGVRGMHGLEVSKLIRPQHLMIEANPDDYDALFIPGGIWNVDSMRESLLHLSWIRNFMDTQKPIGVVSYGAWLLADAGVIAGFTLTSSTSIRKDLERAGAIWHDREIVEDRNLMSARRILDLPAFARSWPESLSRQRKPKKKSA